MSFGWFAENLLRFKAAKRLNVALEETKKGVGTPSDGFGEGQKDATPKRGPQVAGSTFPLTNRFFFGTLFLTHSHLTGLRMGNLYEFVGMGFPRKMGSFFDF